MQKPVPVLGLVIPCFNEEDNVIHTLETLTGLLEDFVADGIVSQDSFITFVDDGSQDRTVPFLAAYKNKFTRIIKLSANRGHQYALLAGLHYAKDKVDCVISMDADMQDDLAAVAEMLVRFSSGAHIICGVRTNREADNWFKRVTAALFYKFMGWMGVPLIENHADFRLLSNRALHEVARYRESNLFLRGLLPLINLKVETVNYAVKIRERGRSKYTLKRMISLALQGITFSSVPIRIITVMGFLLFLGAMLLSVNVLIVYMQGRVVPGWASITLPMYFLGGVQLLSLGVIGEYISKIYIETKRRPLYHIEQIIE